MDQLVYTPRKIDDLALSRQLKRDRIVPCGRVVNRVL